MKGAEGEIFHGATKCRSELGLTSCHKYAGVSIKFLFPEIRMRCATQATSDQTDSGRTRKLNRSLQPR